MQTLQKIISAWFQEIQKKGEETAVVYDAVSGETRCDYSSLATLISDTVEKLEEFGVRPGFPVLVSMENSLEVVVLMLAIWKLGGVYVPLPTVTEGSQQSGLEDIKFKVSELFEYFSSGKVLLFSNNKISGLGDNVECQHFKCDATLKQISIDSTYCLTQDDELARFDEGKLQHLVFDDEVRSRRRLKRTHAEMEDNDSYAAKLAYVTFTSGSSGKPKGVTISRENLATRMASLQSGKKVNQMWNAPIMFDAHINEILESLLPGGQLSILESSRRLVAEAICDHIKKYSVSRLIAVPEVLELLDPADEYLKSLRSVTSMGESPTGWGERLQNAIPGAVLLNEYGPSENTIQSTENDKKFTFGSSDIGTFVDGTNGYVLREVSGSSKLWEWAMRGEKGELFLAGKQLSPGYLDLVQTKKAFLYLKSVYGGQYKLFSEQDKYGSRVRVYKTGDYVSYCKENREFRFNFIGRRHEIAKIHGVRYDLGLIKEKAEGYAGKGNVVVQPLKDKNNSSDVALCCFVKHSMPSCPSLFVPVGDIVQTTAIWKGRFSKHLKEEGVCPTCPFHIFELNEGLGMDDFPVKDTVKGKTLDREQLSQLAWAAIDDHFNKLLPEDGEDQTENKTLRTIVDQVRQQIPGAKFTLEDKLINIGIDSLSMRLLSARLTEVLSIEISSNDVFKFMRMGEATIEDFANNICNTDQMDIDGDGDSTRVTILLSEQSVDEVLGFRTPNPFVR